MRIIHAAEWTSDKLVREVAACVRSGGTVIFPTETVYGIGCAPEDNRAIDAIYSAKGRPPEKPLALHLADSAQAEPYVDTLTDCARSVMQRLWPGPVAIVVRRNVARYARASCGLATISLRCPDHELCRRLLDAAGPLAATSANASGSPPFTGDPKGVSLLPQATIAVLAGLTQLRRESTVVDCTGETPIVVREGALPASVIAQVLGT